MANLVIVGMQWGDEGKGKIVDLLCPAFPHVVRYQGGHNAGHTVKFGDQHFALHLIPSGILHPEAQCYLGNGVVVEPEAFAEELDGLLAAGIEIEGRLMVSDRAHVISPGQARLDQARERAMGDRKIGTTSRGIGPAYEAKVARHGTRLTDLASDAGRQRLEAQVARIATELESLGEDAGDLLAETTQHFERYLPRLLPFAGDVSIALAGAFDSGEPVLFEGAQGTLLDVDHGTYPFVTSSSSTAGGACVGAGVAPRRIDGVLGILKAYTTRVGEGPFPTELTDASGESIRARGNEYGTTTGRPRRCGWLDLVAARYAVRINGIEAIALTKLDVLDDLDEIRLCTGYRLDGRELDELPSSGLERIEPIYESVPGWKQSTVGELDYQRLPPNARSYVDRVERELGAKIDLISTGPRREETIVRERVLAGWLGASFGPVLAGRGAF